VIRPEALRLIEAAQAAGGRELSPIRNAWLAALEVKAHAGQGRTTKRRRPEPRGTRALTPGGGGNRLGTDFFDPPRLIGFQAHVIAAAAPAQGGLSRPGRRARPA
jgi:hypothetical protein